MDSQSPSVSIVIPSYNQAQFLVDAIGGALSQGYQDFEIVLVDDGSTDQTPEVVKQFGGRLQYVYQENQGLAGARNTGILHARGHYIALLDSDDQWMPGYLDTMMALARKNPAADILYGGWRYIDARGNAYPQVNLPGLVSADDALKTLSRGNIMVPSAVVMKRSSIVGAGMFDPAFRRLQDWELWLRLARNGAVFTGSPEAHICYRLHGESLSVDAEGGKKAALAIAEKHFGTDDGARQAWSQEKRWLYGGVYKYIALNFLVRHENLPVCAQYLRNAFEVDPALMEDFSLYYELGLVNQPLGYRGTAQKLDLAGNEGKVLTVLDEVFKSPITGELNGAYRRVLGKQYFALGMIAYNLENYGPSSRYLSTALRNLPSLPSQRQFGMLLLKAELRKYGFRKTRRGSAELKKTDSYQ